MRPVVRSDKSISEYKRQQVFKNSTAYHLFSKDHQYPFRVDRVHFKMRNGVHEVPEYYGVVGGGNRWNHGVDLSNDLIPVFDTIAAMSDYYHDGATIALDSPKSAATIYIKILRHLQAHISAMRENFNYHAPKDGFLKEVSEFATSIRHIATIHDPEIDDVKSKSKLMMSSLLNRDFIPLTTNKVSQEKVKKTPKSIEAMDAIERYLDMIGEY